MAFYTYIQTGGDCGYDYSAPMGISRYVIVEADSESEADAHAESIGLDFDGDSDCKCCGNRWYPASGYTRAEYPSVRGMTLAEYAQYPDYYWDERGWHVFVHYKNGTIEGDAWMGSGK